MTDFVKPFHLTPFEKNINQKANINWDDTIAWMNDRNNGIEAWDDLRYPHYGCRVYNNANISVATSGDRQALTFNTDLYDVQNMHGTVTDTTKLVAPRDGIYQIFGAIEYAANTTGARYALITVNGTTDIALDSKNAFTGGLTTTCNVSTCYPLLAGQYVELVAIQTSGGALNVLNDAALSPVFGMMYVGE